MKDMVQDAQSLLAREESACDRRGFLKLAGGAGFALAVQPVQAQTMVRTDEQGLDCSTVQVAVDGASMPLYVARPAGKTKLPVVLVVSEIFGVHAHIADVARRFAKQGYLALAPQLFVRYGDPAAKPDVAAILSQIVAITPDEEVMADLDAVVAWAAANGGDTGRMAITGFCWGGRVTWLYAAHNPKIKAGVAWYGRLVGQVSDLTPIHPVDIGATLKVPVLGLYGAKDSGIPLDTVEQMRTALAKGSSGSEFVVYPNSGHAFHADYRPSYVEADAKDGFARCLAWMKRHGAA